MRKAAALVLLAGLAGGTQAAPERGLDVRVNEEVSTGSFAEPSGVPMHRTTLRLRYRTPQAWVQADLPWLRVADAQAGALPPGLRADQGFAGLRARIGVPLRAAGPQSTGLDLVLRVNGARTGGVGGLASVEAGQSLRLVAERPLAGFTAFGHVGLRRAGDLPGFARGRHAWEAEIGASRMITPKLEAGAMLDFRQRMRTAAALPEASLYAALEDGDWRWHFFLGRELGRERRDLFAGLAVRASF